MLSAFNIELRLVTIYQDEFLIVEKDTSQSLIYVRWLRHPSSEEFRRLFSMLIDIVLEQKISFWLSDSFGLHYLEFSDQKWLLDQVLPLLRNTSLRKYARITTKERMTLMDMARIVDGIEQDPVLSGTLFFEEFFSVEEALDWLLGD